jgi:hypothetical protein
VHPSAFEIVVCCSSPIDRPWGDAASTERQLNVDSMKGGYDLMGFVLPATFLGAPGAAARWPIEVGRRFIRPRRS